MGYLSRCHDLEPAETDHISETKSSVYAYAIVAYNITLNDSELWRWFGRLQPSCYYHRSAIDVEETTGLSTELTELATAVKTVPLCYIVPWRGNTQEDLFVSMWGLLTIF